MKDIKNKIAFWIAWKLPARVVLGVIIRAFSHASTQDYPDWAMEDIKCIDLYKSWEKLL